MVWPVRPDTQLRGETVELSPVDPERDAEALFAALDDEAVWRHMTSRPAKSTDYATQLTNSVRLGRMPWVIRLLRPYRGLAAGSVIGTSSYLDISVPDVWLEMGST